MATRRRKPKQNLSLAPDPDWQPRVIPPPPDWFAPPSIMTVERPRQSMFSGERRGLVYRIIEELLSGEIARAPWQRPAVWTEAQQIHLLDSMMRGVSVGTLTLWEPPRDLYGLGQPFPGCEVLPRSILVVDGQQRLTAILKAAAGGLDHWRWDGSHWSEGPGFLVPSMAVRGHGADTLDWFSWVKDAAPEVANKCFSDLDAIARTDLHFMILSGAAEHMVETYRRLATAGSPHSVEDLAVMELWLSGRA